jgi:hypothetical protein
LGDLEITATGVSHPLRERLIRLGILLGVLAVAGLAVVGMRRAWRSDGARRGCAILLIVLGGLGLLTGVLPLAGLAALIVGIVLLVQRLALARPAPA